MRVPKTKWTLPVLVGIAVCLIVWRVGFYTPKQESPARKPAAPRGISGLHTAAAAEPKNTPSDSPKEAPSSSPSQPAAPSAEAAKPPATPDPSHKPAAAPAAPEPNQKPAATASSAPAETPKKEEPKPSAPASAKIVAEPNALNVPADEGEAINLKDVEMRLIIQKIADWTGKVVIPTDQIMREKITIYAPGRLPRKEALEQIYGALRIKGFTAEVVDKTIYLKPIRDARIGTVPMLSPDQPLAAVENKDQIVQKYFRLTNSTPGQMSQIVQPLIGESGHISVEDSTSSLFIIDTVKNLMRIEAVIAQFDVTEAQTLTTEIIEVRNRPPNEIIPLLQVLLSSGLGRGPRGGGRTVLSVPDASSSDSPFRRGRGGFGGGAGMVSGARGPIFLVAEPKFNWIIVKAAAEDMPEVRRWIERLDQPVPTVSADESLDKIENKNQIVQRFIKLSYSSPDRMGSIIAPMLGPNGRMLPEPNTNTLLLIDTVEDLQRIEKVIAQFDVPPREDIATQVFELQHREPEEITTLLSSIMGEGIGSSMTSFGREGYRGPGWATRIIRVDRARFKSSRPASGPGAGDQPVVFIPEPRRKWIIVKARPEDMESIATWIKKLDQPMPTIAAGDALDKIENRTQIVQRFFKLEHCSADRMAEILMPTLGTSGRILPESNTNTLLLVDTVENLLRAEEIIAQFDVTPQENVVTQVFELQYREPEEITGVLSAILGDSTGSSTSTFGRDRGRASWSVQAVRVDRSKFRNNRPWTPNTLNEQSAVFIPEPRRKWIIVKARKEDIESITAWIKKLDKPVPTVLAAEGLDKIESAVQIVQRFIKLAHCGPDRMTEILMPLLGPDGRIVPDATTNTLLIIDTVDTLRRMEQVITQFDVVPQENVLTQVFELQYREPDEISSLLSAILGDSSAGSSTATFGRGGRANWSVQAVRVERAKYQTSRPATPTARGEQSAVFIPDPQRKWIIVKARPEDMPAITDWIKKLDKPMLTVTADDSLDKVENKKDVVQRFIRLQHASVDRMVAIITPMLSDTARITPEPTTGTLMIVDSVENLLRIEKIVAQFDVQQRDDTVTQIFELQFREPEEIANLLGAMVGDNSLSTASTSTSGQYRQNWEWAGRAMRLSRFRSGGPNRTTASPVVAGSSEQPMLFIPEPHRKWIIVKARQEDMELIGGWIKRLDKPMPTVTADQPLAEFENKNQVVQKFVKLEHADPTHMSEVVTPLLTENGHVTAEEGTATLLLIDTVENLMRIETVIAQFDVAEADTNTEIFEVRQRSPEEIITLLETVLSDTEGLGTATPSGSRPRMTPRTRRPGTGMLRTRFTGANSTAGEASTVIAGPGGRTVVLVPEVKQGWIIAKASPADIATIRQWIERLDRPVMTVTSDTPLATIENKNQIIQRCIKLQSYSASQMGEIVLPLLSEEGYVSADESTGNLLLIDTVENLIKIEAVIAQFDIPGAEQTTTQVFDITHADPAEVVQVLRMLLSDTPGRPGSGYGSGYGGYGSRLGLGGRGYSSGGSRLYRGGMTSAAANSVIMGPSQLPVVLIPEPKRKWIIARASAEDMKLISEWIQKLDQGEPKGKEYETVPITYADVREVATRINEALQQMPGTELQASVLVQALEQARQVMVFGRQDLREMVKKMIEEIDVPPGQFETRHFEIKHADPDQIKMNIDELFGEGAMVNRSASYRSYGGRTGGGLSPDTVKTISHVSLKQVTVTASPENMKKIAEQVEQWDVAVDVNEVRPRIIELRNSDPKQMATLLKTLFSQETGSQYSFLSYLFGSSSQDKQRIVGPLYGQVTFEEVVGSKKIIVISNIPAAYGIVEDLVKELDGREAAEIPKVVRLNYADPESLSERLNAMFNAAGTTASISLSQRGLSQYSMDEGSNASNGNNNARNAATNNIFNQTPAGEYRPWWTTGGGGVNTQVPISNMIGRARFIPDTHSKSVLVLAPPEFMESLEAMIKELDIPGKQLMLKAIIMQVDHENMTSLGVQYSSDPTRWNPPDNENALVARNTLSALEQSGTVVIDPKTDNGTGRGVIVQNGISVNILIDFLMRELHAKILNQQTLWTKDNEEAQFFKGQRVGFQTQISISDTGGRATSNFTYEKVGMTLRARPSITPEKNVDMIINVILSQLGSESINSQPVRTELDTTTNMVIQDGQTILLGGMLFQEDSRTNRKVPLLGDLPLIGGLFRHKQTALANSELLIFVTPYVIETAGQMQPKTREELEKAQQKLRRIQEDLRPLEGADEPGPENDESRDAASKASAADPKPAADEIKEKP